MLLSGARQTGKTTLALQSIADMLAAGIPARNILYATLDDPILKLSGLDKILACWHEYEAPEAGTQYLILDEIQYARDWPTWLKLQVDFNRDRRILVTGSATPIAAADQESGVGRWHTIPLPTLSFYEYLRIRNIGEIALSEVKSLKEVFDWQPADRSRTAESARSLVPHFYDYLLRGGFPQCARVEDVDMAQRLLRDDIVDKVLKRDMTALYGVRRVLEIEQTFLYLCMHDGGLLDMTALASSLELSRETVKNFLNQIEATHLIYRLRQFGYGKEVLKSKHKVYLADGAIAPSVLLRGKSLLTNPEELGRAVETSVFKHLYSRYYSARPVFSFWRGKKGEEVDVIVQAGDRLIPFEVKYRETETRKRNLKGILRFCEERRVSKGYVVTKNVTDFEVFQSDSIELLKVPAHLFCYWLGRSEILQTTPGGAELG